MIQQFSSCQPDNGVIAQDVLDSVLAEIARVLGYTDSQKLPMYLRPAQTAQVTFMTVGTLATKRCTGIGSPPYSKIGGTVVYPTRQLAEWLVKQAVVAEHT
ncbi:MAG: hypothetical protein KDK04_04705 [Candidatus Competibacteraceae bacterium]|nr:hypothetical protein [Candidatus Competibacteraceae bacterium]MCB1811010.1 hypothetical protein [Candidatus Competibacteraceae bacterium]